MSSTWWFEGAVMTHSVFRPGRVAHHQIASAAALVRFETLWPDLTAVFGSRP